MINKYDKWINRQHVVRNVAYTLFLSYNLGMLAPRTLHHDWLLQKIPVQEILISTHYGVAQNAMPFGVYFGVKLGEQIGDKKIPHNGDSPFSKYFERLDKRFGLKE